MKKKTKPSIEKRLENIEKLLIQLMNKKSEEVHQHFHTHPAPQSIPSPSTNPFHVPNQLPYSPPYIGTCMNTHPNLQNYRTANESYQFGEMGNNHLLT